MVNPNSLATPGEDSSPLHELLSRILAPEDPLPRRWARVLPMSGTMQSLNDRLVRYPLLDFINYNLRGIGQVIFLNNPLSGLLILVALFLQSPWVGLMSFVGVVASTLTAIALQLDRDTIRNGIFGYNGILVGAALATFGLGGNGPWNWAWTIAVVIFSALTTLLEKHMGRWFAAVLKVPPLTLPFNLATLLFLSLVLWLPQPVFDLGASAASSSPSTSIETVRLATSLPIGVGQVFLADQLVAGSLIFLAVAICTPIGALVGLLGCILGIVAGFMVGIDLETLYAGLWGYNAVLGAMAIGGVFYAPTPRSILIAAACAFLSALAGGGLSILFTPMGLPVLTFPFCIVTIGFFAILQESLPSLVPVALHAVATPEEHWQRYLAAKEVITNFRRQVEGAMVGDRRSFLFEEVSESLKGDLRYVFNAIDTDGSGALSMEELAAHLRQAGQVPSEEELTYLFRCMDVDGSGEIDFEEFGELMLRHRRLMSKYAEFVTYFLPIDANEDEIISTDEMNVAMASVGEPPLSKEEGAFLTAQTGTQPLTWNRFIELLLLI